MFGLGVSELIVIAVVIGVVYLPFMYINYKLAKARDLNVVTVLVASLFFTFIVTFILLLIPKKNKGKYSKDSSFDA